MNALSYKPLSWSRRERARRLKAPGLPTLSVEPPPVSFCVRFGFSWRLAVSASKPPSGPIGFPWISLSLSEISLFNGLRGIFEIIFFMGSLARAGRGRAPRTGAFELWKSGIIHSSSVAHFPYFSNQLSSPAIRAEPLPHAEERGRSPARDGRSSERPMASRLEACSRSGRRSCAWSALRDAPSALLGTREVKYPKLSASRTISRRSR